MTKLRLLALPIECKTQPEIHSQSGKFKEHIRSLVDPSSVLKTTAQGRPFLEGSLYDISVSHTSTALYAVISSAKHVGIDVSDSVLPVQFSASEWLQLFTSVPDSVNEPIYWSFREAYFKSKPGLCIDDLGLLDVTEFKCHNEAAKPYWTCRINGQYAIAFAEMRYICAVTSTAPDWVPPADSEECVFEYITI